MSTQGVSQVVGLFDRKPNKFRDWIKSIKKYVLLAGKMQTNQKKFTRPAGVLFIDYIHSHWIHI